MLLIRPATITPAMVTGSNAGAPDPNYQGGVTYELAARVYDPSVNKTFECVQEPALDKPPATSPLYWMVAAPSNRWAMWSGRASHSTQVEGDLETDVVVPERVNAIALFGVVGSAITVTQRSAQGAVLKVVSHRLRTDPADWYEYFFGEPEQVSEVVLLGFIPSAGSKFEIRITGPSACSAVVVGNTFDLGEPEFGATTSIIDYSKKTTSSTGVQDFEPGRFSRRMSVSLVQSRARYSVTQRVLESVRAKPCVWVGVPESDDYAPMSIYGYFRDFSIEVAFPTEHLCSLEIESLT